MGAWNFAFFLQENPMPIKFLFLGGILSFFFGEGGVPILFLSAQGFYDTNQKQDKYENSLERLSELYLRLYYSIV